MTIGWENPRDSNLMKFVWCLFVMSFTLWLCGTILLGHLPEVPYDTHPGGRHNFQHAENLAIRAVAKFGEVRAAAGVLLIGLLTSAAILIFPDYKT